MLLKICPYKMQKKSINCLSLSRNFSWYDNIACDCYNNSSRGRCFWSLCSKFVIYTILFFYFKKLQFLNNWFFNFYLKNNNLK